MAGTRERDCGYAIATLALGGTVTLWKATGGFESFLLPFFLSDFLFLAFESSSRSFMSNATEALSGLLLASLRFDKCKERF